MNIEFSKRAIKTIMNADDYATDDDIMAYEQAMKEYKAGETVSFDKVDWGV